MCSSMKNEELKDWFLNKFNNCYYVAHDDYPKSLFMYYDEKFVRKMKLCKLSGKEVIYPKIPPGICLFEQDYKNEHFFIDYNEITSFLYQNYSTNWKDIKNLIDSWLKDSVLKMIEYETDIFCKFLKEIEKLTTSQYSINDTFYLKDVEKLNMLSTSIYFIPENVLMNILI